MKIKIILLYLLRMVKIFSYKRLHEPQEQEDTFGTSFKVDEGLDLLEGWDFDYKKIEGEEYKIAFYTGKKNDVIMGALVNIPDDEYLEIIDDYEGHWYKRIPIKTASGIECEMYVKRD